MKTKKLSPISYQYLQELLLNYSIKLLLKNVICSPS